MKWVLSLLVFLVCVSSLEEHLGAADQPPKSAQVKVYFSPEGGSTEAVVREISAAKNEILVQAYSLTSQPIVKALLDAHQQGVAVRLILDKSERAEGMTPGTLLVNAGVPVFLDGRHALMHTNIMILDRQTVVTGSFCFTRAAEEMNAEDVLIMNSKELAAEYRDSWEKHESHSGLY
jgi:phosphatidylserine/phosphatidylglycerophosphate/cardiolipin synthase-like enzyme